VLKVPGPDTVSSAGSYPNQSPSTLDKPARRRSALRLAVLGDAAHVNVQRWCEGLTRAGADVHVLSFRDGDSKGWRVYPLPAPGLAGKLHYLACVPHVRRLLNMIRPQVLLSYYVTGYGTLGSLTGFHPIVQVTSGSDLLVALRNPVIRRIVRHNLSRADLVTAWAEHMAEAALANGAPVEKLMALPRGIPFSLFAGQRCMQPNTGRLRLISTRSLRADCNIGLLLEAAHLLQQGGVEFKVTVAGDGPLRHKLVLLADRLGLGDRVRFAGFVSNDALPSLLAQHDMYVALSPSDGVSASLLEAMAVGLFPIVPNHAANRLWIQNEQNGALLDELLPSSIARAIERAAVDVRLRERAWNVNGEIVRKDADLDRNCQQYLLRFEQLLDNPSL
jgi:glycosyltransferase involved in cell wall biosynthesis